mgnify:CR=1 FL=1
MTAANLQRLPAVRQNLQLLPESTDENGAPRWLVFDALHNRYHALTKRGLFLLEAWRAGQEITDFLSDLKHSGIYVEADELDSFVVFLARNELLEARGELGSATLLRRKAGQEKSFETNLIKNYLFFRVPLVHPDLFLRRTLHQVSWAFSTWLQVLTLIAGILGLFLALRQWDLFLAEFRGALSIQGAVSFLLAISVIKIIHELAHGYTARRFGCRVASIGVAFIVLFPILYTDTTDTWRLSDRFKRIKVITAGLKSEIYLAAWATFFWAILPDSQVRSIMFYVATTGWISSAIINLSPLLRFDGYYAFSDLLRMENLQARGFALARWHLRRIVLGLPDPAPEFLPRGKARVVLAYAYTTWVYRFFVFLGIAFLVYQMTFKVLGAFLFVVEIYWFIARPVLNELSVWWARRGSISWTAFRLMVLGLCGAGFVWAAWPMPRTITAPAVVNGEVTIVRAPRDSVVESVHFQDGDMVGETAPLLELDTPDLRADRIALARELRGLDAQIDAGAVKQGALPLLRERRVEASDRLSQIDARLDQNIVTVPQEGQFFRKGEWAAGQWVAKNMHLGQVIDQRQLKLYALVPEADLSRLDPNKSITFTAPWPRQMSLEDIPVHGDFIPVRSVPYDELFLEHGGSVQKAAGPQDRALENPFMAIELELPSDSTQPALRHRIRGVVRFRTFDESLLLHWVTTLSRVIWREMQI